ncbi:hypothetical protein [Acidithiobacillus sp. AMEEHan]|uniref:hypothetical protein n=1 Tax=Acidithiobacillus sp. AMEEHan TaxID=2994951 RepID=UPI0027E4C29E|nr:hypothetical protein [Acidithiobacillus sp. AMEEHan]
MHLPTTSLILIGAAVFLVVAAILWKLWGRKATGPGKASETPMSTAVQAPQPPLPEVGAPAARVAEIEEVSILDEVEIYLAYGHIDQATTALRWYVEHHPQDQEQRNRLRNLYIEALDYPHLAELLEEDLDQQILDIHAVRDLTLQCLQKDPQNLPLRVLAETRLQLSLANIEQELGRQQPLPKENLLAREQEQLELGSVHRDLQQAIVHPEPLELTDIPLHAFQRHAAEHERKEEIAADALLCGSEPQSPLNDEEIRVVSTLVGTGHAVALLREAGQDAAAATLLQREVVLYPKRLRLHVLLLQIFYEQGNSQDFARTLLRLHIILWGLGKALRQRLLNLGRQLGQNDLYNDLEHSEGRENQVLPSLAEKYQLYVPTSTIPVSSAQLVEERLRRDREIAEVDADDPILRDFNMLLDYGQVEEAVDLLEQSALASPRKSGYFLPLLEMYERMQARDRFARFSKRIIHSDPQPDEAILRQLYHLSERLQRDISATA